MKIDDFRDVMPCSLVDTQWCFGRMFCLCFQGRLFRKTHQFPPQTAAYVPDCRLLHMYQTIDCCICTGLQTAAYVPDCRLLHMYQTVDCCICTRLQTAAYVPDYRLLHMYRTVDCCICTRLQTAAYVPDQQLYISEISILHTTTQ